MQIYKQAIDLITKLLKILFHIFPTMHPTFFFTVLCVSPQIDHNYNSPDNFLKADL